jgi:hypothetical protein
MGIDGLIAAQIAQAFGGNYYLIGLMGLFVFGVFCAVLRLPALVSILAVGLMAVLLFAPMVINGVTAGGLGFLNTESAFVWFIVMFVAAIAIYMALKATVWREY